MKHFHVAAILTSLVAFSVTGCASTTTTQPAAKAAEAKPEMPALSADAQQALSQAEAAVKDAKAKFALWIPTEAALKAAQAAAKAGDSDAVIKQSKVIMDQIKASLAQVNYPSTEIK